MAFNLQVLQAAILKLVQENGQAIEVFPSPSTASGLTTSLVWQPGGAPAGNVYATWAGLYAAISALGETHYMVSVDTSLGAAVVPAGAWNLANGSWYGLVPGAFAGPTTVTFADGATITCELLELVFIGFASASAVTTVLSLVAGQTSVIVERVASGFQANGAAPFVNNNGGSFFLFVGQSSAVGDGVHSAVDAVAGLTLVVASDNASVNAASLSGATGILAFSSDVTVSIPAGWTSIRESLAALERPSIGATAARPVGALVTDGQMFFDTTLGIPVWAKAAAATHWVNSVGAPV
jgi:hypothetical protein